MGLRGTTGQAEAAKEGSTTRGKSRRAPVVRALTSPADPAHAIFPSPQVEPFRPPTFLGHQVEVTAFGAQGDGLIDCSGAIADAIEAIHKAGGGTVHFPPGVWFTGRIELKSNVRLHLADEAVLRFSDDPKRYLPAVFVRAFGQECFNYSPLIYARGCSNIAITGNGAIEGRGERWWSLAKAETRAVQKLYAQVVAGVAVQQRRYGNDADPIRPPLIGFVDCRDVLLEGFAIREGGPLWSVHLAYCANSTLRRLDINTSDGPNNDCIVLDSCSGALVEECTLRSRDDCISLKSGLNEDGWRVARPSQGIHIRRTRALAGQAGVAIGSEMSGGVRDVIIEDLEFDGVEHGIRFKAARGRGGVIERIRARDIRMKRVLADAIHMTTDHAGYLSPEGTPPTIRDILFETIRCDDAKNAARLVGLPDRCIEDVHFRGIDLNAEQGFQCFSAQRIHLDDARVTARLGPAFSLRDTRGVYINGLHQPPSDRVFLDLRGRLTRDVRLSGESSDSIRPVIVLGVDVPRDAIFLD